MIKKHDSIKHGVAFTVIAIFIAIFGFLVLAPDQNAYAWQANPQTINSNDCAECHSRTVDLWKVSQHGSVPINCDTCHVLLPGQGEAHPELSYSTEREDATCGTCHVEKRNEWYGGQHGDLNMNCATCHEPHSQQQKLIGTNQTTCEACHKDQLNAGHGSTHLAVGATCETCHIGNDSGHGFNVTMATCNACHSDIHEANRLAVAGLLSPDLVQEEVVEEPEPTETDKPEGGITLPSWLLLLAGLILGGGLVWVLIGKDPGTPTEDNES